MQDSSASIIADEVVFHIANRLCLCGVPRYASVFRNRPAIPVALAGLSQINTANQQRKLFARQLHAAIFRRRPMQAAFLHATCADPQTVRVKEEYLHAVSALVGEEKQDPERGFCCSLPMTNAYKP